MILNVVQRKIEPDITVLELEGRLTLGRECQRVEDMVRDLKTKGEVKLIFDLHGLAHMDSAGLGMLAMSMATMRAGGGAVRIAAPAPRVREALALTQLDKILPVYCDAAAAAKDF
jgi:anti-sigma B factor antagonist